MPLPLKPGYNFNYEHLCRPLHYEMPSAEAYTDFYGLSYILKGDSVVYFPDSVVPLQPGDMSFIPRHIYTRTVSVSDEPCESILLQFTDTMLEDLLKLVGINTYNALCSEYVIHCEKTVQTRIVAILKEIEQEWNNYNTYSELVLKGMLYKLIVTCLRERTVLGIPMCALEEKQDYLADAIKYINAHLRENPSLTETARSIHVSPSYLSKIFVNRLHTSFSDFVLNQKVQCAQKLLVNSDLSMTQIALNAGFSSNAYFSDCFKRRMGSSPTQFRKENGWGKI